MPTFDAGVEAMEFNFEPHLPGVKGVIPEPSSGQIENFLAVLQKVMPTKADADGKMTIDISKIQETFGENADGMEELVNEACSEVCSGAIRVEDIAALPYRVKQRFYGWLMGTLLSPEA